MIPTIEQRIVLVGKERALRETEAWLDGLVAENKRLKFQQDQLRLVLGSGEPLHVDHETLLELAILFKNDLKQSRERIAELEAEIAKLRDVPVKTFTFRIYGEDNIVNVMPHSIIHDTFAKLLHAVDPSASEHDPWEFYTPDGKRLMPFYTLRDSKTETIIASLPIGHGG